MFRLLITGSRTWSDEAGIEVWLKKVDFAHKEVTLVSGSCPRGADAICEKVARRLGWVVERHPANWKPDGVHVDYNQGFVRNKEMVDMGADACLAFMVPDSRGTANTVGHAIRAGIPTTLVGASPFFATFKPA
jgi:hypothetical protein